MNNRVSPEDVTLFRQLTGASERRARIFLLRYEDMNQAVEEYFMAEAERQAANSQTGGQQQPNMPNQPQPHPSPKQGNF
jgi:hypothetical protein